MARMLVVLSMLIGRDKVHVEGIEICILVKGIVFLLWIVICLKDIMLF